MSYRHTNILALFAAAVCISPAFADGNIVIAAQESEALVTARPPNLRLINLPPLTFSLRAAIRCKGEPRSVTLSISDTHQTLDAEELAGQRSAEASLTVPARQLALAATSRFCIEGDKETSDKLLVPGFSTAQASLRCATDDGMSVHYASVPLQVSLTCERAMESAQDSSSER